MFCAQALPLTCRLPNCFVHTHGRRLRTLAAELAAREKEVLGLRERVRAELEAARALAAETAADRAQLGVREKKVCVLGCGLCSEFLFFFSAQQRGGH